MVTINGKPTGDGLSGRLLAAVLVLAAALSACSSPQTAEGGARVRIGYPVTTLINGQIGQILERTNILSLNGLDGQVTRFTHGPPTNEALAAGHIDVGLTSEGPAALGISQGIPAVVALSFGTTRDALMVAKDSPIHTAADLKGRTIGVPFGTTPFLHLMTWLQSNGLDPKQDVKLLNIEPEQLGAALTSGQVDAVEYNEPLPTQLELTIGARAIAADRLSYALLIRRDFLSAHRDLAERLAVAMAEAALFMATNQALVDGWFAEVSRARANVIHKASLQTASYAKTNDLGQVDLGLSAAYVDRLQRNADFFAAEGLTRSAATMHDSVDLRLWQEAKRRIDRGGFDPGAVRIIRPGSIGGTG